MSTTDDNRIVQSSSSASAWTYDAGGDVTFDGINDYLYDAETRICAVKNTTGAMTGYLYDAKGDHIAKGSLTSFSCNLASNGFALTNSYLVDKDGEQLTEIQGTTPIHTNVFAGGKLLATYNSSNIYFSFSDWLGTKRIEIASNCKSTYASLAYGDELTPTGNCPDATENHYTGKERDIESGNDYFGARYYTSIMGRWMSPEYSANGAILEIPQSWNKYGYEYNRPTYGTDPNGYCPPCIGAIIGGVVEGGFDLGKQLYSNGGSLSKVSWGEVGANAAGGAVAGAIAGATGGASLVANAFSRRCCGWCH